MRICSQLVVTVSENPDNANIATVTCGKTLTSYPLVLAGLVPEKFSVHHWKTALRAFQVRMHTTPLARADEFIHMYWLCHADSVD